MANIGPQGSPVGSKGRSTRTAIVVIEERFRFSHIRSFSSRMRMQPRSLRSCVCARHMRPPPRVGSTRLSSGSRSSSRQSVQTTFARSLASSCGSSFPFAMESGIAKPRRLSSRSVLTRKATSRRYCLPRSKLCLQTFSRTRSGGCNSTFGGASTLRH